MGISDNVYGEVFMFDCENHNGFYGKEIARVILNIFEQLQVTGQLEYYAAHVPAWSQNWVVGIVFEKEPKYDFWKSIELAISKNTPENIVFHGMESADKLGMKSSLMFIGHLDYTTGEIVTAFEEGDGNDYFQSMLNPQ